MMKLLDVPKSSQTLVFSKTSLQFAKITPQRPRALYYNDDVYLDVAYDNGMDEKIFSERYLRKPPRKYIGRR